MKPIFLSLAPFLAVVGAVASGADANDDTTVVTITAQTTNTATGQPSPYHIRASYDDTSSPQSISVDGTQVASGSEGCADSTATVTSWKTLDLPSAFIVTELTTVYGTKTESETATTIGEFKTAPNDIHE